MADAMADQVNAAPDLSHLATDVFLRDGSTVKIRLATSADLRLLEDYFMVSMIKSDWNLAMFFSRPISAVLGVITLVVWASPLLIFLRRRWRG